MIYLSRSLFFAFFLVSFLNFCAFGADSAPAIAPVDSSQQIADKIVNSTIPVLIDFWAVWCGPCRILNPIIKELEKEYDGKALFVKVNVDIHRGIASYFGIQAIPSIFIVNNRTVVKALPGLQPKEAYISALNEVIAAAATQTEPASPSPKPATP